MACLTTLVLTSVAMAGGDSHHCLGVFELCNTTQACVMAASMCDLCSAGQYLCPSDQSTCVCVRLHFLPDYQGHSL